MAKSNPLWWPKPPVILSYGIAVLSVTAALLIELWMRIKVGQESTPIVALFLCAVMFSAWAGGFRPGLLATVLFVGLSFTAVLRLSGRITGVTVPDGRDTLPARFAHSLVPIAVGYVIAHYFSYLVFNGQQAFILASDPLGTGENLFGTATRHADYTLVSVTVIALVQVFGVVIGHILGTVAAHDRAVRLLPRGAAVLGQLPLLVLMVGYTLGGLLLLFSS